MNMNALQYIGLGIAIGAVIMLLVVWLVAGYNEKKNKEHGDH